MLWHGTNSFIGRCNAFGVTRIKRTEWRAKRKRTCCRSSRNLDTSFTASTCGRNEVLVYAIKK